MLQIYVVIFGGYKLKAFIVGFILGTMMSGIIIYFFMNDKYIWNLRYDKRKLENSLRGKEHRIEILEREKENLENKIEILRQEKEVLQEQIIDEIRGRNKNEREMVVEPEY